MPDERRYYGLDALRGGMMLLGIVLHAAAFYIVAPPPHMPVATDPNTSVVMDGLLHFIHGFRMPCFFALAGFFTALLVEKRGVAGAYRNRLARIGGPLVASLLTVLPVTLLFAVDFAIAARYGVHGLLPEARLVRQLEQEARASGIPPGIPLMHLWFLLYLGYFYLLIPACRMLVRWSLPYEGRLTRFLASPLSLPVLAAVTALTLWPYPGAQVLGEFIMLGFSPAAFAYYGFFFVVGYVCHHYRACTARLARYVAVCFAAAAVLFPLSVLASHLDHAHPGEPAYHVLAVAVHALCTWTLVWLFVGAALRWLDRPTPWALYASQSAYWVYLLHLPLVCLFAWLLVPVDAHAILKFTVVVGGTALVCFLTYHHGVQDSWIGAFLNGKRFRQDWPWRPGAAVAPA